MRSFKPGWCPHAREDDQCPVECDEWSAAFREILWQLMEHTTATEQIGRNIMTDLSGLKAAVTENTAGIEKAITALNELAAKASSGVGVSQADIDDITATLTATHTALSTAVATDEPAPVVPPVVEPPVVVPPVVEPPVVVSPVVPAP